MFDLINCLSINQDFFFYYNIKIKSEKINPTFEKYNLKKVSDIQLDLVIYDLKIIDLVNLLIYLYPNILDFRNLKRKPFEKNMTFEKLVKMREKYKKIPKRIDIFGEIGTNIYNEDEKIQQLIKYRIIEYNIKYLLKNNKEDGQKILDIFKIKNNNDKFVLFLTNGEFSQFYQKNFLKTDFKEIQNSININSLLIYLNNNKNSNEKNYIDNLVIN